MTEHWKDWHTNQLSREECIRLLCPKTFDFWLGTRLHLLWRIVHWNWFCSWCGKKHFYLHSRKPCKHYRRVE